MARRRAHAAALGGTGMPPAWAERGFWIVVAALALAGFLIDSSYIRHVLILCFLWCIVAASWDLVIGYAGILNYGQLVFFAFGAYVSGFLAAKLGVTPLLAMAIAAGVTGLVGLLIGLPCLRLRGEYVALFTFAVHLAMPPVIQQGRDLGLGGNTGLLGIPPVNFFGYVVGPLDKLGWFYVTLAAAAASVYLIYFVVLRSRLGHAFIALRDSEGFARALGVDDLRYKLLAFSISALFAGFAGALYAHYTTVVTPKILGNEFFLMAMVMLAIGGMGRFPGAIVGAFLVIIGNELLRSFDTYRLLILGIVVVLTVLLLPNGLVSLAERMGWRKPGSRTISASAEG
ncbi:MAG: branched-chain amino acid ABC transporter permease [Hyphomicrobiaceae bacterium]